MDFGRRCHSRLARAPIFHLELRKVSHINIRHAPQDHQRPFDIATTMSTPSKCLATAAKNLRNPRIATVPQQAFASSTTNALAYSRSGTAPKTTCLRELQRIQNGAGKTASSLGGQTRTFSQSASRSKLKTIDQIRARNKGGVRWISTLIDLLNGIRMNGKFNS